MFPKFAETSVGGIPRRAITNPRAMESLASADLSIKDTTQITKQSYKVERAGNQIVMVNPTKLLDRFGRDNPERDVRNPANQMMSGDQPKIEKAMAFLQKSESERRGEKLRGSQVALEDGKLLIPDGRHRLVAAERLGIKSVGIEVKKNTASKYKEFE